MNNRSVLLDNTKIIGALMVIFGHLYASQSVERVFLYAFHMPLFFIISGILHKYTGTIQIAKYFRKIIVPAIVYFLIFTVVYIPLFNLGIIGKELNITDTSGLQQLLEYVKNNIHAFIRGADNSNVVLWFLFALFYCKLFMDLFLKNIITRTILIIFIIVLLGLRNTNFYVGQACMAFPFYAIGYYLKKHILSGECNKTFHYSLLPALLATILLSFFNGRVSVSGMVFGEAPTVLKYIVFYINGIIGSLFVFSLASFVKDTRFEFLAKSLFSVLGLQMIFVLLYTEYMGTDSNDVVAIIASILIFLICYFIDTKCYLRKLFN